MREKIVSNIWGLELTYREKLVMLAIGELFDDIKSSVSSIDEISKMTGIYKKDVMHILRELCEKDLILINSFKYEKNAWSRELTIHFRTKVLEGIVFEKKDETDSAIKQSMGLVEESIIDKMSIESIQDFIDNFFICYAIQIKREIIDNKNSLYSNNIYRKTEFDYSLKSEEAQEIKDNLTHLLRAVCIDTQTFYPDNKWFFERLSETLSKHGIKAEIVSDVRDWSSKIVFYDLSK